MITAVDAHACGEPGRVITGGVLIAINDPHGPDMNQRHKYFYATRTPGIVTAIGGAVTIGLSFYLW